MSKTLIDIGVYQYDNLDEAIQDAKDAANDAHKAFNKCKETKYVLQDRNGYYGPVNEHKRQSLFYKMLTVAYTAEPEEK